MDYILNPELAYNEALTIINQRKEENPNDTQNTESLPESLFNEAQREFKNGMISQTELKITCDPNKLNNNAKELDVIAY